MRRLSYTSSLGTILTMVGMSVGLGNVWRFPYMMGSYGGSAFLLVYLIFTLLFAYPALFTEMTLGKASGNGTVDAFSMVFGRRYGKYVGFFFLAVVTIAGSYYAVVVAQVAYTAGFSLLVGFDQDGITRYSDSLSNPILLYVTTVALVLASLLIILTGLRRGIERISRFVMPFFVLTILYMIGNSLTLPGACTKLWQFLNPDFNEMGWSEIFAALGQAFFSVGLGGTFVVVYAGYIRERDSVRNTALFTCLGDLGSSFLVSLFLIPTILVLGLQMDSGPGLVFSTLPRLFQIMPLGRPIGSLFMLAIALVAFLSLVAAFQVPISSLSQMHRPFPRKSLILIMGLVQVVLIIPSVLFPQVIGFLDMLFGSGMQVFGSLLVLIGVWWAYRKAWFHRFLVAEGASGRMKAFYLFWLRWMIPLTLIVVLIGYVYEQL